MDDKEAINKVRNSFKAKKSRAEILQGFQKKGYKLEYAEKIIEKAVRPKKLIRAFLISIFVITLLFIASYFPFFCTSEKNQIENPYKGLTANSVYQIPENEEVNVTPNPTIKATPKPNPLTEDQIEITPEYISYLLNEIGAWKLRRHPLTLEPPIINFVIGEQTFSSRLKKENIETIEGLDENADLEFTTEKSILINAISSEDPKIIFKESILDGSSEYEIKSSQAELLAKGYLSLYNSLK